MMNSTAGGDFDEDFPPNPFRSTMTGEVPVQLQQPPQVQQQQQDADFFHPYSNAPVTDPLTLGANGSAVGMQPMMMQQQQAYPPNTMYQQQQQQPVMSMYPPQQSQQLAQPPLASSYPVNAGPMDNKMDATATTSPTGQQQQQQGRGGPLSWITSCLTCCSIDTYKTYFDVDTEDVLRRIKAAVTTFYKADHFRVEVLGVGERTETLKGPDLYGPFWITMTLIFVVAVVSNIDDYIHRDKIQEFEYDITHLVRAASILLCFVFVIPAIFWLLTQCLGMQALLMVEWICLYGYAMVIYIPAVLLCLIPKVSWVFLSIATAVSVLLVLRNVATPLLASDTVGQAKASPLILAILGTHAIFLLVLQLSFFHHRI